MKESHAVDAQPGTGGSIYIDCERLQPGDVLLTAQRSPVSWVVRLATRGLFSHAALVIDRALLFEVTRDGAGYTPLSCARLEYSTDVHTVRQLHQLPSSVTRARVLRRDSFRAVTPERLKALVAPFLWTQYPDLPETTAVFDTPAARQAAAALLRLREHLGTAPPTNPGVFCSQLVAAVYEALESPLISGMRAERFSPNRIARTDLADVPGAVTQPDPAAQLDEDRRELINALRTALPFSREVLPELVAFQETVERLKRRKDEYERAAREEAARASEEPGNERV